MNAIYLIPPQRPEDQLFTDMVSSHTMREPCTVVPLDINNSDDLMRPKFQKRSAREFDGRNETQILKAERIRICKSNYPILDL